MKLPVFLQPEPEPADASEVKPAPPHKLAVLLVDDEPAFRSLVAMTLEQDGYHVIEAADGAEAIEVAEKVQHVDLVVTDVRMPQMDGVELTNALRKTQPFVPVVFITGYPTDIRRFVPNSCTLNKPFLREDLMRAIHQFMA
jgi:CheY-like chemotaxis protein